MINRLTGLITVDIPAFEPVNAIGSPSGATHYKLNMAASEIDFESGVFQTEVTTGGVLPIDANVVPAQTMSANLIANSTKPLFAALGVEFYQEVNGLMYSLKNGAYNGLALVKISGV